MGMTFHVNLRRPSEKAKYGLLSLFTGIWKKTLSVSHFEKNFALRIRNKILLGYNSHPIFLSQTLANYTGSHSTRSTLLHTAHHTFSQLLVSLQPTAYMDTYLRFYFPLVQP